MKIKERRDRIPAAILIYTMLLALFPVGVFAAEQTVVVEFKIGGIGSKWMCPRDVTEITVECWGAGGASANAPADPIHTGFDLIYPDDCERGGGGGGAYARSTLSVDPLRTYNVFVGRGGTLGTLYGESINGGASEFAAGGGIVLVKAAGGKGTENANGGQGGQASASVGDVRYSGGNGGTASPNDGTGGGGGGAAGSEGPGKHGNGPIPGGATSTYGGAGGAGAVTSPDTNPYARGEIGNKNGGGAGGAADHAYMKYTPEQTGAYGGSGLVRITYTTTVAEPSLSFAITEMSDGTTVPVGSDVTFSAKAITPTAGTAVWQQKIGDHDWTNLQKDYSEWGYTYSSTPQECTTALSLKNVPLNANGHKYRVIFTSGEHTLTSDEITLTVKSLQEPSVTTHPSDKTVNGGADVEFVAAATGYPAPTVQWEYRTGPFAAWQTLDLGTSPKLKLTSVPKTLNGYQYRAKFTNSMGSVYTNPATLTVLQTAPVVTEHPQSVSVRVGDSPTFSAAATGDPKPIIRWEIRSKGESNYVTISNFDQMNTVTLNNIPYFYDGSLLRAYFISDGVYSYSNPALITVEADPPSITSISPSSGSSAGGTPVTISGSGFTKYPIRSIMFGNTSLSADSYTIIDDNTIVAQSPKTSLGNPVYVVAETRGGITEEGENCLFDYLLNGKDITNFSVPGQVGSSVIDSAAGTVTFWMPSGTNMTSIRPTISISSQAVIYPASKTLRDFTNPVVYTVTAEDGTTKEWIVTGKALPTQLVAPENLAWDDTVLGKATWGAAANASGYEVQLFKDGIAQGDAVIVTSGTEYDFTAVIEAAGSGSYTFKVTAKGDGAAYSDSEQSGSSAEYVYTAPLPTLPAPTGLTWDSSVPGRAKWDAVPGVTEYSVQLYKDGEAVGDPVSVTEATECDFSAAIEASGSGRYTFAVRAIGDGEVYSDSEEAEHIEEYDYTDPAPIISTTALPDGTVGIVYSETLEAAGELPIIWSVDEGSSLPAGLTLTSDGQLIGTPTAAGTYAFTLKATNSAGSDAKQLSITVLPPEDKILVSIAEPEAITGLVNGTEKTASALGLPSTVEIETDDGIVSASVVWDIEACAYDPADTAEQSFTVSGTVTLPEGVVNPNNVPLIVTVSVTVDAAEVTDKILVSIIEPSAITGLTNGTEKTASALGLPSTVEIETDDGIVSASVVWDVDACAYDPAVTAEQSFTVSGTVTLPEGVVNPNNVPLIVTVSVTVDAAESDEDPDDDDPDYKDNIAKGFMAIIQFMITLIRFILRYY